jgi:hypothetical protein
MKPIDGKEATELWLRKWTGKNEKMKKTREQEQHC